MEHAADDEENKFLDLIIANTLPVPVLASQSRGDRSSKGNYKMNLSADLMKDGNRRHSIRPP
ncbi:MAG: hypothetical protein P4M11_04160 [Candidatus Pacebacteria bacterium]|nr:hypothetical protein [Candidatus Paceibacterota bacterium]